MVTVANNTFFSFFSIAEKLNSMESNLNTFFNHAKLHFSLLDAKTDRVSAQLDKFAVVVEPKLTTVCEVMSSLTKQVSILGREMQSLKSRQDMIFIKQDKIQSTLGEGSSSDRNLGRETSVVYTPIPGFASPPTPNVIPTPCVTPIITKQPISGIPAFELPQTPFGNFEASFAPQIDVESLNFTDEDLQSLMSIDFEVKAHSDPGTQIGGKGNPISGKQSKRSTHVSRSTIHEQVNSDSLLDPTEVIKRLSMNVNFDTVGRLGVSLARQAYFGDDVLRVSTLKGKSKQHAALNPHKLEAMLTFIHRLDQFKHLPPEEFDVKIRAKVEQALKDHLKSSMNRSSAAGTPKSE